MRRPPHRWLSTGSPPPARAPTKVRPRRSKASCVSHASPGNHHADLTHNDTFATPPTSVRLHRVHHRVELGMGTTRPGGSAHAADQPDADDGDHSGTPADSAGGSKLAIHGR